MGGKLESTKTNDRYDSNKSDLEQLADTNPSYLLRRTKSTGGTNNPLTDGFVLSDDGKDVTTYNDVTLYSIYPQYSAITTQTFWKSYIYASQDDNGELVNAIEKNR